MLINKFKTVYICIETILPHKRPLGWKQYIPTKRARFRIKLFQLCDSGYIWNSIIYCTCKGPSFMKEYGLSTKSVKTSIYHFKYKGYILTTDNFYYCAKQVSVELSDRIENVCLRI